MPKFFVENKQIKNNKIYITGDDVKHITSVLRLTVKDEIVITDKENNESYYAEIVGIDKEQVSCDIKKKVLETTESSIDITVFQGLPKAEKMEYIIQKTTEIGAKYIIPVKMKRCIVKIDEKDERKKIERWQKIAEVAAKQSGRDFIPTIGKVESLNTVYDKIKEYDLFLIAYEKEEQNTLKEELKKYLSAKKIAVLIGPEGGLDEEEVEKLKQAGAKVITLGKRILRTETAPITLVSNIIYELEM